jgi:hypothetical protein
MYHRIKAFLFKQLVNKGAVLDCSVDETMSSRRLWGKILKIGKIASIGQRIQIDNAPVWPLTQDMANEVCPYKSGTPGHQEIFFAHNIFTM